MMARQHTEIGGNRASFPTTHWSQLAAVRDSVTAEHRATLNFLIERYWKPVYCYTRRRGHNNEDAKDLVQEFFTSWLVRELFGQADPARGRFRSFLLACLDRFLTNARRAAYAKRRRPAGGFVSIHKLATDQKLAFEPVEQDTPEAVFHRAWVYELLMRVLRLFEQECCITGKQELYELFQQRIVAPAMEGVVPPALGELAPAMGLTKKQAANRLITARRSYQRLLRKEIQGYATSDEEVAAEIQDLFRFLANP